jgi:hypothetical protein
VHRTLPVLAGMAVYREFIVASGDSARHEESGKKEDPAPGRV